ncbi:MAG: hypothetical protein VZQ62_06200 [Methanosphaera sp.]|nr:hypothetical protein [Methanosphaera sp.]
MSGRFRYRRRSGYRSGYTRSRNTYSRNRSSLVKRARGNAKAANAQADITNVTINLMHKNMCMVNCIYPYPSIDITSLQNIKNDRLDIGVCAINIFDLLARSEFFNCYAPMYDQFRITSIKVKITPVKWATYNQEYATDNRLIYATQLSGDQPIYDIPATNTKSKNLSNNYQYPQSLTLITAWDRTGLSATQFNKLKNFIEGWDNENEENRNDLRNQIKATLINDKGDPNNQGFTYVNMPNIEELWFTNIGDKISTYSSAQTKQLIAGQNCTINRYLYPQNQQEKSLFYSTNNLIPDFHKSAYDCFYEQEEDFGGSDRLTNLSEDPAVPFKPTLLVGVLGANDLTANKETVRDVPNAGFNPAEPASENNPATVSVEYTPVYKNKIRPIIFNCEFDIGVTFRGLRKTQVV